MYSVARTLPKASQNKSEQLYPRVLFKRGLDSCNIFAEWRTYVFEFLWPAFSLLVHALSIGEALVDMVDVSRAKVFAFSGNPEFGSFQSATSTGNNIGQNFKRNRDFATWQTNCHGAKRSATIRAGRFTPMLANTPNGCISTH